ncbi:8-oxo-dGTP pyrophosphatase MutT (NUDIX family) [Sphingomonas jinjuensis]|uniref:8-oxo-dGTP pyrophosphatase MutT (NUDIX family) n=1 Tax=Sphingomonas jinjuensis TaxID=535907 RepID=A0A840FH81_9SPHN|nr:NUDIX domain-containing protein [Sphingomonas jinjuensis]MBB4153338.1 8-oxo-dGTP pyrophosphatase MutT (NUDIX family) [Sphingomonas jinjuensis]
MADTATSRIAAALIDDADGSLLLVRKAGTRWFMQAGGKIEHGESPATALCRELAEEIGATVGPTQLRHLARVTCAAANEAGHQVDADIFHIRLDSAPVIAAEIAEAHWITIDAAATMPLAPLTRDHILPLAALIG